MDVALLPIYWDDTEPRLKCQCMTLTHGLFLHMTFTRRINRLPTLWSFRSAWPNLHSIGSWFSRTTAKARVGYYATTYMLFRCQFIRLLFFLTDNIVKEIKNLTNKYLKTCNYSPSVCTAFSSGLLLKCI